MATTGIEEAQASFGFAEASPFVGDVRRFGPDGPAYEVVDGRPDGDVAIVVVESGEQLIYAKAAYLSDPTAATIP